MGKPKPTARAGQIITLLKFLAAIVLIQIATLALTLVTPVAEDPSLWWRLALPLGVIALVAAFWLSSLAGHLAVRRMEKLRSEMERERQSFAQERENLRVKAEQDKTRMVRRSHKEMTRETRRANSRANMKVGAAFAAAAAVGVVMMATNFLTLGLLTLTGVGGALGGYLLNRYQALPGGDAPAKLTGEPMRRLLKKATGEGAKEGPKT